jgi:hypothetical protein
MGMDVSHGLMRDMSNISSSHHRPKKLKEQKIFASDYIFFNHLTWTWSIMATGGQ